MKQWLGKGFLKSARWEEETTRLGVTYESDYLKWVQSKITEKEVAVIVFVPWVTSLWSASDFISSCGKLSLFAFAFPPRLPILSLLFCLRAFS